MIEKILNGASQMGISLDRPAAQKLCAYYDIFIEANRHINLTRVTEPEEVADRHFLDSISPCGQGWLSNARSLIDVGSGAGFPGIPLLIACPWLERVVLMDSLKKRVDFLRHTLEKLELKAEVVHARAEDGAREEGLRERFDIATARAVAALPVLCEYTLPFVRVGGQMLAYKGPGAEEEARLARRAVKLLGGGEALIKPVTIPGRDWDHRILSIDKTGHTPARFPRKAGEPGRNPL